MKVRYNRKEDILVLEVSKAAIDHAEESSAHHRALFSGRQTCFVRDSRGK